LRSQFSRQCFSRLPFHLIPQPSTSPPRSSIVLPSPRACLPSKSARLGRSRAFLPLASFFKRQTAELPFIPCLRGPRERTRVFGLLCLFISRECVSCCPPLPVSADSAGETALSAADCGLNTRFCRAALRRRPRPESLTSTVRAILANLALVFRSSCRTLLEPSSHAHLPVIPARGCFRFQRPRGNNPSLRSLVHVEDCVSLPEYYGFLCSPTCVYACVHVVHIYIASVYIDRTYMCTCTSVSMFPYNAKEAP
jgi:hypothetical protein